MRRADNLTTLTLILLTWTRWRAPTNASKWRMAFNSAFKRLMCRLSWNLGAWTCWNPQGPVQGCTGIVCCALFGCHTGMKTCWMARVTPHHCIPCFSVHSIKLYAPLLVLSDMTLQRKVVPLSEIEPYTLGCSSRCLVTFLLSYTGYILTVFTLRNTRIPPL